MENHIIKTMALSDVCASELIAALQLRNKCDAFYTWEAYRTRRMHGITYGSLQIHENAIEWKSSEDDRLVKILTKAQYKKMKSNETATHRSISNASRGGPPTSSALCGYLQTLQETGSEVTDDFKLPEADRAINKSPNIIKPMSLNNLRPTKLSEC